MMFWGTHDILSITTEMGLSGGPGLFQAPCFVTRITYIMIDTVMADVGQKTATLQTKWTLSNKFASCVFTNVQVIAVPTLNNADDACSECNKREPQLNKRLCRFQKPLVPHRYPLKQGGKKLFKINAKKCEGPPPLPTKRRRKILKINVKKCEAPPPLPTKRRRKF